MPTKIPAKTKLSFLDMIIQNQMYVIFLAIRNFSLYFVVLGVTLNLKPQQGHVNPSQIMKRLHLKHLFCPERYLEEFLGFFAL